MDLQLEHQTFRATIGEIRSAAEDFRAVRRGIDADVDSLLHGGWRGVAAEAFADGWADWQAGAQDVLDGLVAMGQLLDAVHHDVTEQDLASQRELDSLATRLLDRLGA
jgi:WXG100 family type VII secretion target